jgi:hypothetical protein
MAHGLASDEEEVHVALGCFLGEAFNEFDDHGETEWNVVPVFSLHRLVDCSSLSKPALVAPCCLSQEEKSPVTEEPHDRMPCLAAGLDP